MVRSLWIAAVVVALAWTGLAWAQSSSSPAAAVPRDRYITVREEGQPPQRCKLLKTWRDANGATAFQVQAVDTGELMTMVESGPASGEPRARAMATRIFRWGRDNKAPAGSPVPPPSATVMGANLGQTAPQPSASVAIPQPAPAPMRTQASIPPRITTIPQPTPSPVLIREPRPAQTASAPVFPQQYPTISSAAASKPSITVVTPVTSSTMKSTPLTPAMALPATPPAIKQVQARQPETHDSTPPGAPAQPRLVPSATGTVSPTPCETCCESSCVSCTPPMRQSWIGRLFKPNPVPTVDATPSQTSKPTEPPAPALPVVKVATELAQPSDWRQSWGKVEPWKNSAQASAERTAEPTTRRVARMPVQMDTPGQPDPLKDPDWYRGMALKEKAVNSKVAEVKAAPIPSPVESRPAVVQSVPAPMPMPSMSSMPPVQPSPLTVAPRPEAMSMPPARPLTGAAAPLPTAPPMSALSPPSQPRGRGIELSATDGNAFSEPATPPPTLPPAPKYNAFQRDENSPPPQGGAPAMMRMPQGPMSMNGAPMPMNGGPMPMNGGPMPMMAPRPPMPPPMVDSGVPSGMSNAFTMTSTRRPIPADFGPTQQEPNGFGDAVPYVPGPARPVMQPQSPMLPASPGSLGTLQLPMPPMQHMTNPAAMPQSASAINPLMGVPSTSVASAAPAAPSVPQMLATLKDSLYPSQREWAAEQLSESNVRTQPQIVQSLATCAKEDPAATVRAACVHALAHLKVNTNEVVALVQELKNDRDPRVRQEADEALNTIGVAAVHQDSAVQPVSHK